MKNDIWIQVVVIRRKSEDGSTCADNKLIKCIKMIEFRRFCNRDRQI